METPDSVQIWLLTGSSWLNLFDLKEMDEVELSLSQAESKYDEYVEMCRNLRDENQHLKDDFAARSKEQEDKIAEIKRGANHNCFKG